ncbi:transcription initiation factor TFIID subunit 7-like [Vanessa tameamea]|uniref:Transcription initiation factor TFIID subunit 7-like n=1 Tax=Vanessa tameamea TaxID=334116 RepID=A0A8B8IXS2_VANTA|nr:transcription initiation factor TFIID subunit 7-like [Vanessa atalanta]
MSRDKRETEYPVQLETQFIIRLPEEPAKVLRELITSGENFKNRVKIQIHDDLRHGELRVDHWLLHTKIVDLPTIVESWKTIDRKSLYKTADICQMMICKEELDDTTEDEAPTKNKKKDPLKVDKKYLWPHGITPPTKNVRRRRFRKTLRKKCAESPEIEKEVKRLLRADNEAVSFTWEVVKEEDEHVPKKESSANSQKAKVKKESHKNATVVTNQPSKVEDIFGGALSDSDADDENVNVDLEDSRTSAYDDSLSDVNSVLGLQAMRNCHITPETKPDLIETKKKKFNPHKSSTSMINESTVCYELDNIQQQSTSYNSSSTQLQELVTELEELKQRRQRTQLEISRMENMTLRQRFQDILKTLNKEIVMKEMEYHKLKSSSK